MRLFVASTNPAKIRQLTDALAGSGADLGALDPAGLPVVAEDASDAIGNARVKAAAFAAASAKPCLAMDAALFLPGLPESLQPGVHVRRLPGSTGRPTDEEVLEHYTDLCRRHGGRLTARWTFGFAIGHPDGRCFDGWARVERALIAPPSSRRRPGYPLDSLQWDPRWEQYLADLSGPEEQALWQEAIGGPLRAFVDATVKLTAGTGEPTPTGIVE